MIKISMVSLILLAVLSVDGAAQEYTRWGLPDGAKMRLGKGTADRIAYSPDGTRLAVAGSIGIWLYDAATYKEVALLSGHTAPVGRIAFNSGGSEVASWSSDKTARVWSAKTGEHLRTFCVRGHQYARAAISADGSVLACQFGFTADLWDVQKGELKGVVRKLGRATGISISADGRLIACGNSDGTVHRWDADTGKQRHTLAGHTDEVRIMAFSPVGNALATASFDRTVRLWNTKTGAHQGTHFECPDHIASLAFGRNGKKLAIGLVNHDVELWKIREMWGLKKVRELQYRLAGHRGTVGCLAFHPDGSTLASGSSDGSVRLWDTNTGENQHTINGQSSDTHRLVYSPDGSLIASVRGYRDKIWYLWDSVNGAHLHTFNSPDDGVERIVFSPNGKMIAGPGGQEGKTVRLWNPRTGEIVHTLAGHTKTVTSVAFSPDGRTLASGSRDNSVRLWDTETWAVKRELVGHERDVLSVAFNPDGSRLASGGRDGTVRLWDPATGELLRVLTGHKNSVHSVAFARERSLLASAGHNEIRLWDVNTGELLHSLSGENEEIDSIEFNSDGSVLCARGRSRTVKLWATKSGRLIRSLSGHHHMRVSVALSPDGRALACMSTDYRPGGSARLKDGTTAEELVRLPQGVGQIQSIAFSPDGTTLATGGWDGTVLLWDSPFASARGGASGE